MLRRVVLGFFLAAASAVPARACPRIHGLIDFNCDQKLKYAVTGDSIVYGVGDERHENQGGYVLRLGKRMPNVTFANLGVRGITTAGLIHAFKQLLNKPLPGVTKQKLHSSDFVLVDVGRNDFWEHGSPGITVRNLSRIVRQLRQYFQTTERVAPFVIVATLLPTTRGFQRSFIENVNTLMLKSVSSKLPVYLRFDTVPSHYISHDGIHPTSQGYGAMASLALTYLKGRAQEQCEAQRVDADHDGVYDIFETSEFATDPRTADTDGDGYTDGEELFSDLSDPLSSLSHPGA